MIVENLSVCQTNTIFMEKGKDKTVSLWPLILILALAFILATGSMVLALFITN